ncbi:Heat stress transcription factor A-5 [Apostasia shenzhenica]|uniref:Heat stress transcription factor A-5 n=1 Tax=Apostasia shenzhenica TaxID=1088818 RepID=A0A2I0AZQ3_9ASPA|nr:Heat stress transcription factor A-5 [Apostasia shenzhenica]
MEQTASTTVSVAGAGGGGPAPFLLKTYEMVDDSSTDEIVSWSSTNASFIVWDPPQFSSFLLPTYFKHNNFSSFIRQLNTYGFRKIDSERWEFANEEFVKDQKHLLKNIHRRKPIHSHSNPPTAAVDPDRAALEDEIERLQRDKVALQADLWRFKNQQSGTKIHVEDLERRLRDMEQRQAKMIAFLQRAVQNPKFVENLVRMADSSASMFHKKRRLPGVDYCAEAAENSFCDNSSSSSKPAEVGYLFSLDFCDKLKLELSPAIVDGNLVSPSAHDSDEDDRSPFVSQANGGRNLTMECLPLVPQNLELSDTGPSMSSRKDSLLPDMVDDDDARISCHLNLTLASSSIHVDSSNQLSRIPSLNDIDVANAADQRATNANTGEDGCYPTGGVKKNAASVIADSNPLPMREAAPASNQAPRRINDVFWEQFLTERPGSLDTEEASSTLREDTFEEQREQRMPRKGYNWRNREMEQLSL